MGNPRYVGAPASRGRAVAVVRRLRPWSRRGSRRSNVPTAAGAGRASLEHGSRSHGVANDRNAWVVVISASVGAGHDGATTELARRLREQGFRVDCMELSDMFPWRVGRMLRGTYHAMLSRTPWIYDGLFTIACNFRGAAPITRALFRPMRRRVRRLIPPDAQAVVSAYPLASQILGPLRRDRQLAMPVITYLTDFAVHPIWVSPGIDVHCAGHETSRAQARSLGASDVRVAGRLVSAGFRPGSALAKRQAREQFGLPADEPLALLVAGSWGIGDVAAAAAEIAGTGAAVPIVICGRNAALYHRLKRNGVDHVFGWVDDMPTLLKAVDVLVENAGGLTALEAMACGLPVATYRPIAGHGKANATTMAKAGVVSWVRRRDGLKPTLTELIHGAGGQRQRDAGLALFREDPTTVIADIARGRLPTAARPVKHRPRRLSRVGQTAAMVAIIGTAIALAWNPHAREWPDKRARKWAKRRAA